MTSAAARADPTLRLINQLHRQDCIEYIQSDLSRLSLRSNASAADAPSAREQPVVVDVKINNIVGSGISGMLYKWVNYGKGWRPRWFVLQDGVLSYYKIHGPDKIVVNRETEKGSKVIGEESMRRIHRPSNGHSQLQRKPCGEIHLKVCVIYRLSSSSAICSYCGLISIFDPYVYNASFIQSMPTSAYLNKRTLTHLYDCANLRVYFRLKD